MKRALSFVLGLLVLLTIFSNGVSATITTIDFNNAEAPNWFTIYSEGTVTGSSYEKNISYDATRRGVKFYLSASGDTDAWVIWEYKQALPVFDAMNVTYYILYFQFF